MGKFFKKAEDLSSNLMPQFVHPDGTVPSYSVTNNLYTQNSNSKPKSTKPILPSGPKPQVVEPPPYFAATEPSLPSGPTNPTPSITIDPGTQLATVTGHKPDNRKDMNYWFADYALRQERGLHHPVIRPLAHARQKLKDKGFNIHTLCPGGDCKPGQSPPADPTATVAAAYEKRLKKIIATPKSRQTYVKTAGKWAGKILTAKEARKLPGFHKSVKQVKHVKKLMEENIRLKKVLKKLRDNYSFTRKITKKTERKN